MVKGQRIAKGAKQLDEIIDDDRSIMTEEFSVLSEEENIRQNSNRLQINQQINVISVGE